MSKSKGKTKPIAAVTFELEPVSGSYHAPGLEFCARLLCGLLGFTEDGPRPKKLRLYLWELKQAPEGAKAVYLTRRVHGYWRWKTLPSTSGGNCFIRYGGLNELLPQQKPDTTKRYSLSYRVLKK